jgi:hypothetical protein
MDKPIATAPSMRWAIVADVTPLMAMAAWVVSLNVPKNSATAAFLTSTGATVVGAFAKAPVTNCAPAVVSRSNMLAANGLMIALFGGMAFGTHQTLAASPTWAAYLGWAFANAFSALRVM